MNETTFMKNLLITGVLFSTSCVAVAASLELQPGTLLEELRTGVVTISDDKISTDQGETAKLKLMKTVTPRDDDSGPARRYFEVVGDDKLLFCEDATAAHYIEVGDYGDYAGVVITAFQKRTNAENRNYVARCGEFSLEHPSK